MNVFDLHTHSFSSKHKSIVNIYPNDFEMCEDIYNRYLSCGVHPWYFDNVGNDIELLKTIAQNTSVVAIGEAGLDKLRGATLSEQAYVFEQQIAISEDVCKPMIIHCVKAWDMLLSVYKKMNPIQPWIIHGFRGGPVLSSQLISSGMYISIGEKYNLDTVRRIPIERVFCETDESEVSIEDVYISVSNTMGISLDNFSAQIQFNVDKVFNLK